MAKVIDTLRQEHANIAKLLDILEAQLGRFDRAEAPDYEIVQGIADYFVGFPDRCHHPKEDLVYGKLRVRDPAAAAAVGDLEAEHAKVADRIRRFAETIGHVTGDLEVSREFVDRTVRAFIGAERRHMALEEERFFPAALQALTDADWAEIDAQVGDENDPVFGDDAGREFAAVRENIIAWDAEGRDG